MRKNVVCMFTSREYYPLAYVLSRRLAAIPARSYDIIIYTDADDIPTPDGVSAKVFPLADAIPGWARANKDVPPAIYYRLFLGDLLPEQYERALYLDVDITLKGDLEALFALDLQGKPIAAIADYGFVWRGDPARQAKWDADLRSVNIKPDWLYMNAGVLLADLAQWRRLGVSTKACDYMRDVGERLNAGKDQDALNYVFGGQALELSPRWNFQTPYFDPDMEDALRPVVYHHLLGIKPWHDLAYPANEHSAEFAAMLANSPWPGFIKNARAIWHRKFAWKRRKNDLKWRARRAFRFLPPVAKRLGEQEAKHNNHRAIALAYLSEKLDHGAFGDLDKAASARLSALVLKLQAGP